ncbi:MAG: hypothetical protein M3Z27_09275 [Actinomycetota bacterium]|nr:hypothetical protein [Actinomycetota bacterium]
MGLRQRILAAALVLLCAFGASCAFAGAHAPAAKASATQQSILIDDDELIYSSPEHMARRLGELHALGVDVVKASMVWSLVAPDAASSKRPNFHAADPAAYPPGAWDRYDTLVRLAHAAGMRVYFQLNPPTPLWALARHQPIQGPPLGRVPIPSLLRQFVQAVGRRYSGTYGAPLPATEPSPALLGLPALLGRPATRASVSDFTAPGTPVPKVDTWGIWNEPNERSWLNPWHRRLGHGLTELLQPRFYRSLVDAAWGGLRASGHARDTILIGETANKGILQPVPFVRALYCVSSALRPLRGQAAAVVGCPVAGGAAAFARAHPGLFSIAGYAHHPYTFDAPPNVATSDPNVIALSNLGHFERTIDRIMAVHGVRRPGGVPLYLTEWGYKTKPPNPYVHTTLAHQAAWLNEGEYMTWRDPRVHALAQFELVDSPPELYQPRGSPRYWSSFQTGLILRGGTRKPSYAAFRLPIWLPSARHGASVTVWGQLRPADHSTLQFGAIQFRPPGGRWRALRVVQTTSREGFLLAHVAIPSAGRLRLAWVDPQTGALLTSRTVTIS